MIPSPPRRAALLSTALAALAALAACEEGLPNREPLRVRAASGGRVDLSRTQWEVCRADLPEAGRSQRWREVHGEEGAVTFIVTTYDAPGCTGTAAAAPPFTVLATAVGELQVGWTGGAPPAELAAELRATAVVLENPEFAGPDVYFLDDRVPTARVLYSGDPDSPRNGGFQTLLLVAGAAEQQ